MSGDEYDSDETIYIICNYEEKENNFTTTREIIKLSHTLVELAENNNTIKISNISNDIFTYIMDYLSYRNGSPSEKYEKALTDDDFLVDIMDKDDVEFISSKTCKELLKISAVACSDILNIPCLKSLACIAIGWKIKQSGSPDIDSIKTLFM